MKDLVSAFTNEEIENKMEMEGFDSFWNYYIADDEITDNELWQLVSAYKLARRRVRDYLSGNGVRS